MRRIAKSILIKEEHILEQIRGINHLKLLHYEDRIESVTYFNKHNDGTLPYDFFCVKTGHNLLVDFNVIREMEEATGFTFSHLSDRTLERGLELYFDGVKK